MDQVNLLQEFYKTIENTLLRGHDGTFLICINRPCVSLSLRKKGSSAQKSAKRTESIRRKLYCDTEPPVPQSQTLLPDPLPPATLTGFPDIFTTPAISPAAAPCVYLPRVPRFTNGNPTAQLHGPLCKWRHTADWSDILDTYCEVLDEPKIKILHDVVSSPVALLHSDDSSWSSSTDSHNAWQSE